VWQPLAAADRRHGAKAAALARLVRAGFPVPDGIVLADPAAGGWPEALAPALRALGAERFAVRSSAEAEDGARASFAGQLHTTLNVPAGRVAEAVRRTAGSGRGDGLAAYQARTGRRIGGPVPVLVQVMVDARAAGVAFTRHPVTGGDELVIEAVHGLGERLVAGAATPERWTVPTAPHRWTPAATPHRWIPTATPHRWAGAGGAVAAAGTGVLTSRQAGAVADTARRVEALFGCPQDVEWAIADGRVWVLQARPITTAPPPEPTGTAAGRPLVTGTPASPGTATGAVRVIGGLDAFDRFDDGEVLVCRATSPAWTPLLARAAAVVTETGGMLAHAAIVAREFAIPAVTAASGALTRLADGRRVLVDGTSGTVTAIEEEPTR
jgi:pyruvate,water dikinase